MTFFYSHSVLYLLLAVLSLVVMCLSLLSATIVSGMSLSSAWTGLRNACTILVSISLSRAIRNAGILGLSLGILMGIPLGMRIESQRRDSNMKERHGVIVMSKESPRVYYFIDQKAGRQYRAVFCEDHDFEVGERFDSIKYLNTGPCWSLKDKNSSYFYSKGEQDEGWYPNADANAYARSNSVSDPQARPTAWNFPLAFLDGR